MVKLLENTFRAVNIGLVNELALMCDRMNIDVWEVVDAAKTKPFGFMAFYPGPGLGGHCIPIDPFYLSWKAKQTGFDPRFIELAGHINAGMPHYVVDKVGEALNERRKPVNGSHVLIAGVAYKRDIDDMRESPAMDVMGLLLARGAKVSYADPFVPVVHGREWSGGYDITAVDMTRGQIAQYDCVVIVTDHKAFDYKTPARRSGPDRGHAQRDQGAAARRYSSSARRARPGPRKGKRPPRSPDRERGKRHASWKCLCRMTALFWISALVVGYVYVGYPCLLAVWARLAGRRPSAGRLRARAVAVDLHHHRGEERSAPLARQGQRISSIRHIRDLRRSSWSQTDRPTAPAQPLRRLDRRFGSSKFHPVENRWP